jgi:hypothetical protein
MHESGIVSVWCDHDTTRRRRDHSVDVALGIMQVGAATGLITWLALNVL